MKIDCVIVFAILLWQIMLLQQEGVYLATMTPNCWSSCFGCCDHDKKPQTEANTTEAYVNASPS